MTRSKPDFSFEARFSHPVAGVDEVGRGPLAGPVTAAAVILNPENIPAGLNDSKVLTAARREALFAVILATATVSVAEASVEEIDALNIDLTKKIGICGATSTPLWQMEAVQKRLNELSEGASDQK